MSDRHLDSIVKPFPRRTRRREGLVCKAPEVKRRQAVAAPAMLLGVSAFSAAVFSLALGWMMLSLESAQYRILLAAF